MYDETTDYINKRKNFFIDDRLYITGNFNESITNEIIPQFPDIISSLISRKNPSFEIIINSPGGYDYELLAILYYLDIMKKYGIKIITRVIAEASSCASLLACYGDERIISRYGHHTMHYGVCGSREITTPLQNERQLQSNIRKFDRVVRIYEENINLSKEEIINILKDDYCELNAEQCIEYGLADYIE